MGAARLRRAEDIARVRAAGIVRSDAFFTMRVLPTAAAHVRVAVSASRALGGAVRRNRARRRVREAIRTHLLATVPAHGADIVVAARSAVLGAPAAELRRAVGRELDRVLG